MKKLILLMMMLALVCCIGPSQMGMPSNQAADVAANGSVISAIGTNTMTEGQMIIGGTTNEVAVVESAQLTVMDGSASQEMISASDALLVPNQEVAAVTAEWMAVRDEAKTDTINAADLSTKQNEAANDANWMVVRTEAKKVNTNSANTALEIANNGKLACITAPEVARDKTVMTSAASFVILL